MNMCQGALVAVIVVLLALPCSARTEGAGAVEGKVRPLVLPVEAKETYVQMARYALHAYANADSKNPVQALPRMPLT